MNSCDGYEPLLADVLFGELSGEERARVESHLSECDGCTQVLDEMRETLDVMDERAPPAPSADFWTTFDERLAARLNERDADKRSERRSSSDAGQPSSSGPLAGIARGAARRATGLPPWARYGALALGSLLLGLMLGRTILPPSAPSPAAPVAMQQDTRDAVPRRVRLHLARSKVLLIELDEFDPGADDPSALRLPDKRGDAQSLAVESETLQAALSGSDQERLQRLLSDLRDVLVQIAALKSEDNLDDIEALKVKIEGGELVMRINLEELRLTSALQPTAFAATGAFASDYWYGC